MQVSAVHTHDIQNQNIILLLKIIPWTKNKPKRPRMWKITRLCNSVGFSLNGSESSDQNEAVRRSWSFQITQAGESKWNVQGNSHDFVPDGLMTKKGTIASDMKSTSFWPTPFFEICFFLCTLNKQNVFDRTHCWSRLFLKQLNPRVRCREQTWCAVVLGCWNWTNRQVHVQHLQLVLTAKGDKKKTKQQNLRSLAIGGAPKGGRLQMLKLGYFFFVNLSEGSKVRSNSWELQSIGK